MKEDYRTLSHRELTEKWIKTGYDFYTDIPPFINEEKERIKKEYKQFVKPDDWGDLEEDFEILTPDNISKIATGKPTSDKRYVFLSNIVSGIFDVDRLDYLRRDAYHSGVNIGNIDIWEIINSYTLAEDNGLWIAKLMPSAVTSLEILLTIRDLTYRQFYYNKSHRTAQEMIIRGMGDMVPKISIDKMIIMNDEELLREFEGSNGNSFTEDVSQRIRITNIYESLPLTISVFNDLDENSKRRWYELAFGVPNSNISTKEWLSAETEASSKLKLPSQNKVIFDIRHVPIVNLDEYKQKKFYDENEKVSLSLFDLAPHLKRTKGLQLIQTDKGKFEIDSTRNYIEEISKLYILIPFEYLNAITESCIDDIKKESNKTEIYKKHIINLEEVVDVFIKFLDIKDENFIKKLKERFKKDMCIYLDEYIQTKT
jgi:HD superfamily phosphohydrolase